jgi:hypothetical protein
MSASFVYARVAVLNEDRRPVGVFAMPGPEELLVKLLTRNVLAAGSSNVVARRSELSRVEGFDEGFAHLADWDLWIRLAAHGRPAGCTDVLVGYVEHSESMLLVDDATVADEFDRLIAKHRDLTSRHGVEFDRGAFTRWLAITRLRAGRSRAAVGLCLRDGISRRDLGSFGMAVVCLGGKRALSRVRQVKWEPRPDRLEWLATNR